jgi:hypothetical protein
MVTIKVENIGDWQGEYVIDPEGAKVGKLTDIYVDTTTDEPLFAVVRVGLLTSHRMAFVPLHDATVSTGYVRVAYSAKEIKQAPALAAGSDLPVESEVDIFNHYQMPYRPADTPGGRRLARR